MYSRLVDFSLSRKVFKHGQIGLELFLESQIYQTVRGNELFSLPFLTTPVVRSDPAQ